ncbi:hypothetical protein PDG61_19195 [Mycolicibacterium sp. BiH015]|uniref:hypothetical protein n=1 Tax=Mycolicibacterium sp. BiH015 TaxID=3018808 RepID=UPI0022E737F9|nr:hypothetical protein [Mycolicibacterium sp. BiH015]MDA2893056.1 hypothetical protein [Mycolicibacterium sp. BiH015]
MNQHFTNASDGPRAWGRIQDGKDSHALLITYSVRDVLIGCLHHAFVSSQEIRLKNVLPIIVDLEPLTLLHQVAPPGHERAAIRDRPG